MDTNDNEAFAHWVFESAIYFDLFDKLKIQYPDIKINLKTKRDYKNLFFKFFEIQQDDIVYDIKENNICFFIKPIYSLCINSISEEYKLYVDVLYQKLNSISVDKKTNPILF